MVGGEEIWQANSRWPPLLLPLLPGGVDQAEATGEELGDLLSAVMQDQALGPLITTALVLVSRKGHTKDRHKTYTEQTESPITLLSW